MRCTLPHPTTKRPSNVDRFRTESAKVGLTLQLNATVKSVIEREKHVTLVKYLLEGDPLRLQKTLSNYAADAHWLQTAINTCSRILRASGIELYCTITRVRSNNGVRDVVLLSISSVDCKRMVSISSDLRQEIRVYALPGTGNGFRPTSEDPEEVLGNIAKLIVNFFNQRALNSDLNWQYRQTSQAGGFAAYSPSPAQFSQYTVTV